MYCTWEWLCVGIGWIEALPYAEGRNRPLMNMCFCTQRFHTPAWRESVLKHFPLHSGIQYHLNPSEIYSDVQNEPNNVKFVIWCSQDRGIIYDNISTKDTTAEFIIVPKCVLYLEILLWMNECLARGSTLRGYWFFQFIHQNYDVPNFMTYQVFNAILNVHNCFSLTSLQW